MPENAEYFLLKVDVSKQSNGVTQFTVFQTPAVLWKSLPQAPQNFGPGHEGTYFKSFSFTHQNKGFTFTFYYLVQA